MHAVTFPFHLMALILRRDCLGLLLGRSSAQPFATVEQMNTLWYAKLAIWVLFLLCVFFLNSSTTFLSFPLFCALLSV